MEKQICAPDMIVSFYNILWNCLDKQISCQKLYTFHENIVA